GHPSRHRGGQPTRDHLGPFWRDQRVHCLELPTLAIDEYSDTGGAFEHLQGAPYTVGHHGEAAVAQPLAGHLASVIARLKPPSGIAARRRQCVFLALMAVVE